MEEKDILQKILNNIEAIKSELLEVKHLQSIMENNTGEEQDSLSGNRTFQPVQSII